MLRAPFSEPARDERDRDQRLGLDGSAGNVHDARIEMRAVRPDGRPALDRPAGEPFPELGAAPHDLLLVPLRPREHGDQLAVLLVRLVDVQRVVGHEVRERAGDAVEEGVDALLGENVVEDLGQTLVRLDEGLGAAAGPDRDHIRGRCRCSNTRGTSHGTLIDRGPGPLERPMTRTREELRLADQRRPQARDVFGQGVKPRPLVYARRATRTCAQIGQLSAVPHLPKKALPKVSWNLMFICRPP